MGASVEICGISISVTVNRAMVGSTVLHTAAPWLTCALPIQPARTLVNTMSVSA